MKPAIPKGTRDFLPDEMVKRNYIFDTIKSVFQLYGYMPLETPAMENMETLMGKYGDEGDKLIFKILNSGNYLSDFKNNEQVIEVKNQGEKSFTKFISEKALRYDLTVPFARYVVMHQNEITFPFKRYQIQPVWRADRPQKGRYREFYQCDADVIGSNSLLNEVELIQIIDEVFSRLGLTVLIKINNRKILYGIAEYFEMQDKFLEFLTILDKIDKIELSKFKEELISIGFNQKNFDELPWFATRSDENGNYKNFIELLDFFKSKFEICNSNIGLKGFLEMETISKYLPHEKLSFDPSLARGLNYYTGTIIEVVVNDLRSQFKSSILGGGRYDDLTGIFGLPNVSGVGISFGADRIYDVLEEAKLFPDLITSRTQVLFVNFGMEEEKYCLKVAAELRNSRVSCEVYPDQAKMKKQMSYADAKKIPYVVLVGSEEMQTGLLSVKNMMSGEQEKHTITSLIDKMKNK